MNSFFSRFPVTRHLALVTAISSLALTACATTPSRSLPVQTRDGQVGTISTVRTYEHARKFTVSGSAQPTFTSGGHHVDVQLLGANGQIIAEQTEELKTSHPRGSRARHGRGSFVASFPLETAHQASSVRVSFHSASH